MALADNWYTNWFSKRLLFCPDVLGHDYASMRLVPGCVAATVPRAMLQPILSSEIAKTILIGSEAAPSRNVAIRSVAECEGGG